MLLHFYHVTWEKQKPFIIELAICLGNAWFGCDFFVPGDTDGCVWREPGGTGAAFMGIGPDGGGAILFLRGKKGTSYAPILPNGIVIDQGA